MGQLYPTWYLVPDKIFWYWQNEVRYLMHNILRIKGLPEDRISFHICNLTQNELTLIMTITIIDVSMERSLGIITLSY